MALPVKNKKIIIDKKIWSFAPLIKGFEAEGYAMHGQRYHTYVLRADGFVCAVLARSREEAERIAQGIQRWREAEARS